MSELMNTTEIPEDRVKANMSRTVTILKDCMTKGSKGTIIAFERNIGKYEVSFNNGSVGWYLPSELDGLLSTEEEEAQKKDRMSLSEFATHHNNLDRFSAAKELIIENYIRINKLSDFRKHHEYGLTTNEEDTAWVIFYIIEGFAKDESCPIEIPFDEMHKYI